MNLPRTQSEVQYSRTQGRIIYDRRTAFGMTRKQLAVASGFGSGRTGVHRVARLEMGDSTANAFDLARIARALQVTVEELCPDPEAALPPRAYPTVDTMLALASRTRFGGAFA